MKGFTVYPENPCQRPAPAGLAPSPPPEPPPSSNPISTALASSLAGWDEPGHSPGLQSQTSDMSKSQTRPCYFLLKSFGSSPHFWGNVQSASKVTPGTVWPGSCSSFSAGHPLTWVATLSHLHFPECAYLLLPGHGKAERSQQKEQTPLHRQDTVQMPLLHKSLLLKSPGGMTPSFVPLFPVQASHPVLLAPTDLLGFHVYKLCTETHGPWRHPALSASDAGGRGESSETRGRSIPRK